MAAGSAFDAYIKSHLHYALFGGNHKHSEKYTVTALIEAQVESHNRDWAIGVGAYLFACYKEAGCVADLLTMLEQSALEPRFEFDVRGAIKTPEGHEREGMKRLTNGVPLLGKPDVYMVTADGFPIIHDFKVNGYCSTYSPSPMPGYLKIRPTGQMHKGCMPTMYRGLMIDGSCYFEFRNTEWAEQLATYGWLLGEKVGTEFAVTVDQLVCKGGEPTGAAYPEVRIAQHRSRVSEQMQYGLLNRYMVLWDLITAEPFYFFRDQPYEDSVRRCELLDKQAVALYGPLDAEQISLLDLCQ